MVRGPQKQRAFLKKVNIENKEHSDIWPYQEMDTTPVDFKIAEH